MFVTVIPQLCLCQGAVSLWQQCVGRGSVYSVFADSFLVTLSTVYINILPERASDHVNTGNAIMHVSVCLCVFVYHDNTHMCSVCVRVVFWCLVERILDDQLPRRGNSRDRVSVTLFQLWTYVEANSISDMETHIRELAEEGKIHTHTHTHTLPTQTE